MCNNGLRESINVSNHTYPSREYIQLLKRIAVPFNKTFIYCRWRSKTENCSKIFTEVITEEGICYTFNVLDGKELFRSVIDNDFHSLNHNTSSTNWTLEKGYKTNSITTRTIYSLHKYEIFLVADTYPRRVLGSGFNVGITIKLAILEKHLNYRCQGNIQGFKVILHSPGEIPRVSKQFFRVPINQEVIVSVKPQMMTTDEGLNNYAPER